MLLTFTISFMACNGKKVVNQAPDQEELIQNEKEVKAELTSSHPTIIVAGTEPFWSATIVDEEITLEMIDQKPAHFVVGKRQAAMGRPDNYIWKYQLNGAGTGELILKKTGRCICEDGMSDIDYPIHAFLVYNGELYEGCGRYPEDSGN